MTETKFLDYDARRTPKTPLHCVRCQRDLDPRTLYRAVAFERIGEPFIVRPEDSEGRALFPIGRECVKVVGAQWTLPERSWL